MDSKTLSVVNLRTEYRVNPLGIDIRQPHPSWQITASGSDVIQSAYQIQVTAENEEIWNTGQVKSSESIHVPYTGPALRSGKRYHWRVRVWDRGEQVSDWSQPAWWEMGLVEPGDWKANWIDPEGESDPEAYKPCPYLRKTFHLADNSIERARAYITCHGLYELWISGDRIGDQVLTPWHITRGKFTLSAIIPPNTTGTVRFPAQAGGEEVAVGSGIYEFNKPWSE